MIDIQLVVFDEYLCHTHKTTGFASSNFKAFS